MKTHLIRPFKTPRSPLVVAAAILLPHLPFSTQAESTPQRPEALTVEESAWSRTLIGGGVKTSDSYTDGSFFLTIPLWSTLGNDGTLGGSYLFLEPYSSWGEGGEVVTSLGLGFRHLFSDQSVGALKGRDSQAGLLEEGWYVGSSLFVDLLDTETNHQFWQLGVGAEIGSRYFELRGNYYIPMTRSKEIERVRDRQTYVSTSSRSSTESSTQYITTGTGYGDPYAAGHSIRQDVDLTTTAYTTFATTTSTTTTKTTIETLFRRFEEGMEGWDVEAAVLVPYLDRWFDLQLLGGYFSYDNQPFGAQTGGADNVHGWKAGVEFRPVPAIALSAMWYEDDRLTGGDWTAGIRFEIPIGKEWKDAFKSRRRHLIERMAEPVARQNAAVKLRDYVTQKQDQQTSQHTSSSTTTLQEVTRVVSQTQTQTQLVLADDVVFVNNGGAVGNGIQAGSPTGDGTAERPVDTVQGGAGIAGGNSNTTGRVWTLYTQGNGPAYTGDVNLSGSTRMVSSWSAITTPDGRNFGGNTDRPILNGGIGGVSLPFVEINGYDIRGGRSTTVPGAKLVIPDQDPDKHSVQLQDFSLGLRSGIYLEDVGQVIVRNNVLTSQLGRRIVIGANAGKTVVAEVSNNVSMDDQSLAGPELVDLTYDDPRYSARAAYWDTHPTSGITLAGQDANLVASVSGNTLKFNSRGGLEVWLSDGTWSGDIAQNQFYSEYRPILIDASNTAWRGSIVDNSVFRSAATSNLLFDDSTVTGNFSGNLLEAPTGNLNDDGWDISNTNGSWTGSITNNTLLNSGRGIYFWSDEFHGVVAGNRLTSLAESSVNTINLITSGTWDGDVYDNILDDELRIRLFGENGKPVHWHGDIYQNTISDELISIRLVGSGTWDGDVRNNTLTGSDMGLTGIWVSGASDTGAGFTWKGRIAGNTITGALSPGIDVNLSAFGAGEVL